MRGITPFWLAEPAALGETLELVIEKMKSATLSELRAESDKAYDDEPLFSSSSKEYKPYAVSGSVALISMNGGMTKNQTCMSFLYGGVSTRAIEYAIQSAYDDGFRKVLLSIDSPGGNVDGTAELGNKINAVRENGMIVWAWVDGLAASAAYWVASQCDQIYASSQNAMVGSIGVITAVADQSGVLKNSGVKVYKIDTGEFKGIGAYFSPVSDAQIEQVKSRVMEIGTEFAATVARGRGIDVKIGEGIADGRVFRAEEAKKLGMIDGIAPVDSVIKKMQEGVGLSAKDRPKITTKAELPSSAQAETNAELTSSAQAEGEQDMFDDIKAEDEGFKAKLRAALQGLGFLKPKAESESTQEKTTEEAGEIEAAFNLIAETVGVDASDFQAVIDAVASAHASEKVLLSLKEKAEGHGEITTLIEDGVSAREAAAESLAINTNRVLGAGTLSVEDAKASMQGKSLTEVLEKIKPFKSAGDAKFQPNVDDAQDSGRQAANGESDIEAAGREAAESKDLDRVKKVAEELTRLRAMG